MQDPRHVLTLCNISLDGNGVGILRHSHRVKYRRVVTQTLLLFLTISNESTILLLSSVKWCCGGWKDGVNLSS